MPTQQEALDRWAVMTRKEAHGFGYKRYYTGKPCVNGHNAQRAVSSGICCECNKMYAQSYRKQGTHRSISIKVECHPDDVETVRQFVAGLNVVRENATMAAAPSPDMSATRLAVFPDLANAPPGYVPAKPTPR